MTLPPIVCPDCASSNVKCLFYRDGPWLGVVFVYLCQSCKTTFEVADPPRAVTVAETRA